MLAQQNIETLNEAAPRTDRCQSCPHCFNALANEYPQLGGNYEVIHHTQLLSRLVAEGKLTPVTPVEEKITYHDPCFLGRHNKVYSPPREIMEQVPGVQAQEMHRCKDRGFCCGAGGARMWMEERIGKRINTERIDEALGTNPDTISTACPYCLVMLGDAISAKKSSGEATRVAGDRGRGDRARPLGRPGSAGCPAGPPASRPARPPRTADRAWASRHGQPPGGGVQRRRVRGSDHGPGVRPAGHRLRQAHRWRAAARLAALLRLRRQLPDDRDHVDEPPHDPGSRHPGGPAAAGAQPAAADGRRGRPVPHPAGRRAPARRRGRPRPR